MLPPARGAGAAIRRRRPGPPGPMPAGAIDPTPSVHAATGDFGWADRRVAAWGTPLRAIEARSGRSRPSPPAGDAGLAGSSPGAHHHERGGDKDGDDAEGHDHGSASRAPWNTERSRTGPPRLLRQSGRGRSTANDRGMPMVVARARSTWRLPRRRVARRTPRATRRRQPDVTCHHLNGSTPRVAA